MQLKGGPNIYGIPIGILGLDSAFAKPPGHIKNASTFDFPVLYKTVRGATTHRLINEMDRTLLEPFVAALKEMEQEGVMAVTGSCGFLALFQKELADAVDVPVFISSLIQVPMVHCMLKSDQSVGILTAVKKQLTPDHLRAVRAQSTPVCIAGMDDQKEFMEVIIEAKRNELDFNKFEAELLSVAGGLIDRHPEVGAVVLECTDMPYFAHKIQKRVGRPVFDLITLTQMVYQAVLRQPYCGIMPAAV